MFPHGQSAFDSGTRRQAEGAIDADCDAVHLPVRAGRPPATGGVDPGGGFGCIPLGQVNVILLICELTMKKTYEQPALLKRERVAMIVASMSGGPYLPR